MQNHLELSNLAFEQAFENCSLHPDLFSHEAHLRLAWIHIQKYGLQQAIQNIESQLKNYVQHVGATDKYHHTVTIAALYAVHHFIQKSDSYTFQNFLNDSPKLKSDFKALLNSHYTFDIFTSQTAQKEFIQPDLIPFD